MNFVLKKIMVYKNIGSLVIVPNFKKSCLNSLFCFMTLNFFPPSERDGMRVTINHELNHYQQIINEDEQNIKQRIQ